MRALIETEVKLISGATFKVTDTTVPTECMKFIGELADATYDIAGASPDWKPFMHFLASMPSSPCTSSDASRAILSLQKI